MDVDVTGVPPSKKYDSESTEILSSAANVDNTSDTIKEDFPKAMNVDTTAQKEDDLDLIEQTASQSCTPNSNPTTMIPAPNAESLNELTANSLKCAKANSPS